MSSCGNMEIMKEGSRKIILGIFGFLIFVDALAWLAVWDLSRPQLFEVDFFDVGQGDSIFIETPGNQQILIDGGPDSTVLEKLGKEMPFWDRTIDLVILTHPDYDHLDGLIEVLKSYRVEKILWTGVAPDKKRGEYDDWLKALRKEKAEVFIAQAGQSISAGDVPMEVLSPLENLQGQELANFNNSSVVIKAVFGQNSFLFTGDISKTAEKKIIGSGADVKANVLKIAHHGSNSSTSEELLTAVSPETAVISVGAGNTYGHPSQGTLDILNKYGIRVLRTDQQGDIKIISDGNNFKIINSQ